MELFSKDKIYISPSLICLDMLNILEQIRTLEEQGAQMLHIDILDGHFSPSMPLGFELVKQLREKTDLAFECHVMAKQPEYFVDELLSIGVQQIVFHMEEADHVDGLLNYIHNKGVRAGVALKPSTPIDELNYVIEKCDAVLLMLINPGYASCTGESQVPYARRKITDLRHLIQQHNTQTLIELDGRISLQNIKEYALLGANIFVGGTTCIDRNHIAESYDKINQMIKGD